MLVVATEALTIMAVVLVVATEALTIMAVVEENYRSMEAKYLLVHMNTLE